MIILIMNQSIDVQAEEVRSVQTAGSVGFYGAYEPENEPKPVPPSGTKPIYSNEPNQKGNEVFFKKTCQLLNQQWFWLGLALLLLFFFMWEKKQSNQGEMEVSRQ